MTTETETDYRGEFLTAIDKERQRQIEKLGWSPEHDERHEPHEWIGLIAQYVAQGRWVQAAALCSAAYEALNYRADHPSRDPDRPTVVPCVHCGRVEWSNTHADPDHPEYHEYADAR